VYNLGGIDQSVHTERVRSGNPKALAVCHLPAQIQTVPEAADIKVQAGRVDVLYLFSRKVSEILEK
jgi:hypothetical protein